MLSLLPPLAFDNDVVGYGPNRRYQSYSPGAGEGDIAEMVRDPMKKKHAVDLLASAAHLHFLVRLRDMSNVSQPRWYSLGETRAMFFQKRTEGRIVWGGDGGAVVWPKWRVSDATYVAAKSAN
jgi:hypothetical protein